MDIVSGEQVGQACEANRKKCSDGGPEWSGGTPLYVNAVWVNVSITAGGRLGPDSLRLQRHRHTDTKTHRHTNENRYRQRKTLYLKRNGGYSVYFWDVRVECFLVI